MARPFSEKYIENNHGNIEGSNFMSGYILPLYKAVGLVI
jgi:hypothetical protein